MTYRKIEVDGKTYQYVVGKTHVKVKGIGAFPKTEVEEFVTVEQYCDCCGEPLSALYDHYTDPDFPMVLPRNIADLIRKNV